MSFYRLDVPPIVLIGITDRRKCLNIANRIVYLHLKKVLLVLSQVKRQCFQSVFVSLYFFNVLFNLSGRSSQEFITKPINCE